MKLEEVIDMSTEFEFDAKVKEADDIDIKEYSFSPTLLENGVIDYSNIEHDKIFLVNKHDILEKEKPDWIPELDLDGLMADEFLPTTIKSSDGFYYVQAKKFIGMGAKSVETKDLIGKNKTVEIQEKKYETTVYKMSSDILAATVDYYIKKQKALNKQVGKKETVGLPRRTKSMYTSRFQNMVDLLRFIPEYKENEALLKHYPNRSKSESYRKQNKIIFDQYKDLLGNLKDKILDLNLDKIDYGNAYTKGEITSYGDTGLSNSLYEDFGVRIKKQNGSTFSLEQKNRVESVLKDTYTYYGDLSNISKDFNLKVSYADNCRQHARKAIGLFTPYHNAIGVSFFDDNTYERTTAVHEFAHFLDYTKGNEFSYRYASDKDGSLENQIATKYKKLIREQNENNKSKVGESKTIKLGDYWYRTCECFARAMEQDFELTIGLKEKCNPPAYLPEEIFNKEIKPLIEELKKENEIKLNLIPGKFVTWTTKIKNKINEQEMSDRERNNLIWLEEVHGCDKEKTAIVLHKLYEKFSESEAFERSKALPTVFGKLRKQSESFELDFNDSSINVEELDTVLGIYDENITYHTVLDREWAVRHGMSKKEAAHLLEWDYSKAEEHKFIEIINNEELKEQEKENMSDVFDNKIENDEEYAMLEQELKNNTKTIENAPKYEIPRTTQTKDFKSDVIKNKGKTITYKGEEYQIGDYEAGDNLLLPKVYLTQYDHNIKCLYEKEFYNTIEFDSIFETVSKEFNEKNKDFFNIYEEEKSKQIENLSKNISNIKEKMLFSTIHSEMLKIRIEELKEMVKRCPNKDIALAVGIRYFNYFGNIEGNISHQNIYTRFGIGHYEKDQMVYPTPEELKSFISKLYENSKTQETYMWIHNKDGSSCLKAQNGEKYFQYDPDANEVKITEDSNWIRRDELNLGDKTFTQYAEDYVLENNAATYISFETNGKNIEKEQNVDESKQYSFFVKDTAEFEMYEEFETITGLTAKEAISEYKKLREDGLAAGIGINIPSDTTFDDPKGLGTTILVRENGIDTFDSYGDSFIVDLKENNERSQNRIAAYKELYEEAKAQGLNVKEPTFLFEKERELNPEKPKLYIITENQSIRAIKGKDYYLLPTYEDAENYAERYREDIKAEWDEWKERNTFYSPATGTYTRDYNEYGDEEDEHSPYDDEPEEDLDPKPEKSEYTSYEVEEVDFDDERVKKLIESNNYREKDKELLTSLGLFRESIELETNNEPSTGVIPEAKQDLNQEIPRVLNKFWSEADIVDTVPDGWKKDQGVTTVPNGYVAITNGKSRFADGEKRETKLIREENYKQNELELDFATIQMMPALEEAEKQITKEEFKLPFSIINNEEKGRVNIKFDQKISSKKFNHILKELKAAGWRFSSYNKQWYPMGKAVENSTAFATTLQEKYSKADETVSLFPQEVSSGSMGKISESFYEKKSVYDGIKFFDRNYKEIDEFLAYFNSHLDSFKNDVQPIDENQAITILDSLQVERIGTLNSREIRLGLDEENSLILLNKKEKDVVVKKVSIQELLALGLKTLQTEDKKLNKSLEEYKSRNFDDNIQNIFEKMLETAKLNNEELLSKMSVICDTYLTLQEKEQQLNEKSRLEKIQNKSIKPLTIGDVLGSDKVVDVYKISKSIYQATLADNTNSGIFSVDSYFVVDNSITSKINPELIQYLNDTGERSVISTSSRVVPHLMKELIDKGFCPPRDNEYYQQLVLHTEANPLKYEGLYPVTKYDFKNKLKQICEIDKDFNHDVLTMGKQLLAMAKENDKKQISKWLRDDIGCSDEKSLRTVFTNWVSEKEIKQEKKKDGYPPRGDS